MASLLGLWSTGTGPLYRQLADVVARLIETGVLRDDERLPAERAMAGCLQVSRGTVVAAYGLLAELGLVERVQGSGTRVVGGRAPAVDTSTRIGDPLFATNPRSIDLLTAVPRMSHLVLDLVSGVDLRAHRDELDDFDPAGLPELRAAIAERLTLDGLPSSPDQILVTAGAQHAMLLVTSLLVGPGDVVICEELTWPGLVDNVARFGGRVHPVAMDGNGIVVDELRQAVERLRPVCIALNPHHHNPTGSRLSPERRRAVAELACDYGVTLVEDRVLSRLAFDGQVPPPLAAEVGSEPHRSRLVTIDSISKTAWPGLRVGWLRADAQIVAELRSRRALTDLYSSIPSQLGALRVLDHHDIVVEDRIAELRQRADLLSDLLTDLLPMWRFDRPRGGLAIWAQLPDTDPSRFTEHAARFGVQVGTGRQFGATSGDDHVRLPYTASPGELTEAVRRLTRAWDLFEGLGSFAAPAAAVI